MLLSSRSAAAVLLALSTLFLHSSGLPFSDGEHGDRHEGVQTLAEDDEHSHGPSQAVRLGDDKNLVYISHDSHPTIQSEPDGNPRKNRHDNQKSATLQNRTSSASVQGTAKTSTANSKTPVPKKPTASEASALYTASDPGESSVVTCKSKNRRAEQVRCAQRQPVVSPATMGYVITADEGAPDYFEDDYSKTYSIRTPGGAKTKQAVDVFALDAAGTGVGIFNAQNGIEAVNNMTPKMSCSEMLLGFFTEQTRKPASALRTMDVLEITNSPTLDAIEKVLKLYAPSKYGSSDDPIEDLGSDKVTLKSTAANGTPEHNAFQTFLTDAPFGRMATRIVNGFVGTQGLKITQLEITKEASNPRVRISLST